MTANRPPADRQPATRQPTNSQPTDREQVDRRASDRRASDRRAGGRHLRAVEVVRMGSEQKTAAAEITRLFEVAGRESDTIRRLDGCVAELHEVMNAKSALHRFSAAELRAALNSRRRILGGGRTS